MAELLEIDVNIQVYVNNHSSIFLPYVPYAPFLKLSHKGLAPTKGESISSQSISGTLDSNR
jgi:hypothetical protein